LDSLFRPFDPIQKTVFDAKQVQLFNRTYVFTGGEIVKEFLLSTGTLPGAHDHECPVYEQIARKIPAWMQK